MPYPTGGPPAQQNGSRANTGDRSVPHEGAVASEHPEPAPAASLGDPQKPCGRGDPRRTVVPKGRGELGEDLDGRRHCERHGYPTRPTRGERYPQRARIGGGRGSPGAPSSRPSHQDEQKGPVGDNRERRRQSRTPQPLTSEVEDPHRVGHHAEPGPRRGDTTHVTRDEQPPNLWDEKACRQGGARHRQGGGEGQESLRCGPNLATRRRALGHRREPRPDARATRVASSSARSAAPALQNGRSSHDDVL